MLLTFTQKFGLSLEVERLNERFIRIVKGIVEALKSYQDLPYLFFGHSIGGLIGSEVIRESIRLKLPSPDLRKI